MESNFSNITIVGAGLAGSELAWQLANSNIKVILYEMRPKRTTPAHTSEYFAEMVCSNSFRSGNIASSAVGLLHQELRELNSLIIQKADANKVPAGDALAVDRWNFAKDVTDSLRSHPNIKIINEEFKNLAEYSKDNIVIVASGPLTSEALSNEIKEIIGHNYFNFFDAIAPIIYKDSIDFTKAWYQSRYNRNATADYINCALSREEYEYFYNELTQATYHEFKDYEKNINYFEGCLPIEELAKRGNKTLLFGPMKPVGLENPHSYDKPYAVLQLRQDNKLNTLYNMVGFQTKLIYSEQIRIFRLIPALKNAEFVKLGSIHKNTYINSPLLLNRNLSLKNNPNIFFAGQITGCEGYVESTAVGLICSLFIKSRTHNVELSPPRNSALDAILNHITDNFKTSNFQPSNINFGLFEDPNQNSDRKNYINKDAKKQFIINRALESINQFKQNNAKILQHKALNDI